MLYFAFMTSTEFEVREHVGKYAQRDPLDHGSCVTENRGDSYGCLALRRASGLALNARRADLSPDEKHNLKRSGTKRRFGKAYPPIEDLHFVAASRYSSFQFDCKYGYHFGGQNLHVLKCTRVARRQRAHSRRGSRCRSGRFKIVAISGLKLGYQKFCSNVARRTHFMVHAKWSHATK